MGERPQQAPLAERIAAINSDYEEGTLNWRDYTLAGIHLAAERFDEVRVNQGQEPIHSTLLLEVLSSNEAQQAWDFGHSGLPPLDDEFGYEQRKIDYATIRIAITSQYGEGYVPCYLMSEIFHGITINNHLSSRPDAVLRAYRSEEGGIPEPYFALFMLDLLAWKSIGHVHDQFNKNIDLSTRPAVAEGMERVMWTDKVKKFQQYSAFATKALAAIHRKAEGFWGEKRHAALEAFRSMTFLKTGAFNKSGGPGQHRIEIMRLLAAGAVDDANARVSELVNNHPEYFSTRTQKMYLIDTSL